MTESCQRSVLMKPAQSNITQYVKPHCKLTLVIDVDLYFDYLMHFETVELKYNRLSKFCADAASTEWY